MNYFGALLVILGCGGFGFSMAAAYKREERLLRQLQDILQFMYCELQFHLTPLPELCTMAGSRRKGSVESCFVHLGRMLQEQRAGGVSGCMETALENSELSPLLRELLEELGRSLGCFDLEGQLLGLKALSVRCTEEQKALASGREDRLRCYQTLGLCAGAALVILFV